jgi:hypothetical protein
MVYLAMFLSAMVAPLPNMSAIRCLAISEDTTDSCYRLVEQCFFVGKALATGTFRDNDMVINFMHADHLVEDPCSRGRKYQSEPTRLPRTW